MDNLYHKLADLAQYYGAQKLVLYGSRARGDNRTNSDLDLAVFGMNKENQVRFVDAVDELDTLYEFDLVFVGQETNKVLLGNIEQDGIILMEKKTKKESLLDAVKTLKKAISEYEEYNLESSRDGAIQRFEFCSELAWKAAREYLIGEGVSEGVNAGPKTVMRKAFAYGIIEEEQAWITLLQDRNLTSHIYDEETADKIYKNVKEKHLVLLEEFASLLNNIKN